MKRPLIELGYKPKSPLDPDVEGRMCPKCRSFYTSGWTVEDGIEWRCEDCEYEWEDRPMGDPKHDTP